jgi:hypothetical protein
MRVSRKDARQRCGATSQSAFRTSFPQLPSARLLKRYEASLPATIESTVLTLQQAADGLLLCTLEDGILRDQYSRTGSIVSNHQFQFDGPPQAGALYTGGFSVCQNKSLAIGGSTRWWRCMSGEFGNLYDTSIGEQCTEIRILVDLVDKPTPSSSSVVLASSTSSTSSMSSTSAADLTLATSGTRTASVVSSSTDHASHSMTSSASTGVASLTASSPISSSVTVTRSSVSSSRTSQTSVPEAPEADGGAPTMKGATIWSVLVTIGAVWVL